MSNSNTNTSESVIKDHIIGLLAFVLLLYKTAPWIVSLFPNADTMNVFFIILVAVVATSYTPLIFKYFTEFIQANRTWYWCSSILLIVLSVINYHWLSGFISTSISGVAAWMIPGQTSPVHTSQQMTIDWGTAIVGDKTQTYYVWVMPQKVNGETPWYNHIWLYIQYIPVVLFVTRYLWLLYVYEKTKRST